MKEKVFIIGSGFMGTGIAQNAIQKGLEVSLYDISQTQLEKAKNNLEKEITKQISRGKITEEEGKAALGRITFVKDLAMCADADVIIEAVSENKNIKIQIIEEIDRYARKDAVVASNTSSIRLRLWEAI